MTDSHSLVTITGDATSLRALLMGETVSDATTIAQLRRDLSDAEVARDEFETELLSVKDDLAQQKSELEWQTGDAKRAWAASNRNAEDLAKSENARRLVEREAADAHREVLQLRAELADSTRAVDLSDDEYAQIAEKKQALYAHLVGSFADLRVRLADGTDMPLPPTVMELFNLFFAPIFEAGNGCKNKIAMIKAVRAVTGAGLLKTKNFIEEGAKLDV